MNHFSDKEYQILKQDTAEVRASINRYIGYIITITGVSGFIKFYFDSEIGTSGTLTMFFVSLLVLTLLFEVVWYKFKSHNRMVGYMQLLMQEVDAFPYHIIDTNKHWKNKDYIKYWKIYKEEPYDKGLKHCFSWEFVMSRLNSNQFNKNKDYDDELKSFTNALDKSNFIFSLPTNLMAYTGIMDCYDDENNKIDRDVDFVSNIVFPIHKKNNSIAMWSLPPFKYLRFLYFNKNKDIKLDHITVEKRYLVYGWGYPRKITQIAFMAVCLTYAFFTYYIVNNYEWYYKSPNDVNTEVKDNLNLISDALSQLTLDLSLPLILFIGSSFILRFWFMRYVKGLKELVYGKHSIDYYCWDFFVYRVQMLNNKDLVPMYYSRAYIRYFKSKLYLEVLEYNKNKKTILKIIGDENSQHLETYITDLKAHKEFSETTKSKALHSALVKAFKAMKKNAKKPGEKNISKVILQRYFEPIEFASKKT
ncbi:hypothetical protein [uncultured Winogradskyella sp.]|uniref:hypothetical protein n=1 Tax=uncultured Winogradskyella sp. TaxID=395353 RepID=UPI00262109C7|nr:hypothetical protein [uncultured Winogradskyella sp.]